MNCHHCGGEIDPLAVRCSYCGVETIQSAQQRLDARARAERANEESARARRNHVAHQLERLSKQALAFSLGGLLCCGILTLVGGVLGVRAKMLAAREKMVAPWQSTVALVVAPFVLGLYGLLGVVGVVESNRIDKEIAAIETKVEPLLARAELDRATACDAAHLESLRKHRSSLKKFLCEGALRATPEGMRLEDVEVALSDGSNPRVQDVCFVRKARWRVASLDCSPLNEALDAGESARASARSRDAGAPSKRR